MAHGTVMDLACLVPPGRLCRREGLRLRELVGLEWCRLGRDTLPGLASVAPAIAAARAGTIPNGLPIHGQVREFLPTGGLPP